MKRLTVSYFGCIDRVYSRNKTNIDGLRLAGAIVHEVIVPTPVTPLNTHSHLDPFRLMERLFRKLQIIPLILSRRNDIHRSDIIFVGYPGQFDLPFGFIAAKIFKKKLVFDPVMLMYNALSEDIHIIHSADFMTKALKLYERLVMRLPDLIIASSVEQKNFFIEQLQLSPSKITVIYLAADNKIYKPGKSQTLDTVFRAVYYGLFTPIHGTKYLLDAAKLCQNEKKIIFQFFGKGQLFEGVKKYVEKHDLQNVELYPEVSEKNALSFLQRADVFFGFLESSPTSLREIPNKVYQGIALGKAVITSDSPAIHSVFTNRQNIFTVPSGDSYAIADAVRFLAKERDVCEDIGKKAYGLFLERFTPSAIGLEMRKTFHELLCINNKTDKKSVERRVALRS